MKTVQPENIFFGNNKILFQLHSMLDNPVIVYSIVDQNGRYLVENVTREINLFQAQNGSKNTFVLAIDDPQPGDFVTKLAFTYNQTIKMLPFPDWDISFGYTEEYGRNLIMDEPEPLTYYNKVHLSEYKNFSFVAETVKNTLNAHRIKVDFGDQILYAILLYDKISGEYHLRDELFQEKFVYTLSSMPQESLVLPFYIDNQRKFLIINAKKRTAGIINSLDEVPTASDMRPMNFEPLNIQVTSQNVFNLPEIVKGMDPALIKDLYTKYRRSFITVNKEIHLGLRFIRFADEMFLNLTVFKDDPSGRKVSIYDKSFELGDKNFSFLCNNIEATAILDLSKNDPTLEYPVLFFQYSNNNNNLFAGAAHSTNFVIDYVATNVVKMEYRYPKGVSPLLDYLIGENQRISITPPPGYKPVIFDFSFAFFEANTMNLYALPVISFNPKYLQNKISIPDVILHPYDKNQLIFDFGDVYFLGFTRYLYVKKENNDLYLTLLTNIKWDVDSLLKLEYNMSAEIPQAVAGEDDFTQSKGRIYTYDEQDILKLGVSKVFDDFRKLEVVKIENPNNPNSGHSWLNVGFGSDYSIITSEADGKRILFKRPTFNVIYNTEDDSQFIIDLGKSKDPNRYLYVQKSGSDFIGQIIPRPLWNLTYDLPIQFKSSSSIKFDSVDTEFYKDVDTSGLYIPLSNDSAVKVEFDEISTPLNHFLAVLMNGSQRTSFKLDSPYIRRRNIVI
ncbi:MAG: hypothetical protein ACRCVW_02420 [Brevinema sp.]